MTPVEPVQAFPISENWEDSGKLKQFPESVYVHVHMCTVLMLPWNLVKQMYM